MPLFDCCPEKCEVTDRQNGKGGRGMIVDWRGNGSREVERGNSKTMSKVEDGMAVR